MTVAQVFYIGAGQCEPLDIVFKGFTLYLEDCPYARHILGLPLMGHKMAHEYLVQLFEAIDELIGK